MNPDARMLAVGAVQKEAPAAGRQCQDAVWSRRDVDWGLITFTVNPDQSGVSERSGHVHECSVCRKGGLATKPATESDILEHGNAGPESASA